jgi:hypothetical protein
MALTRDFKKTVGARIERDPSFARARLDEVELARVRRAMDAFMQQRRPPLHIRSKVDLGFRVIGQSIEIFEIRPPWQDLPTRNTNRRLRRPHTSRREGYGACSGSVAT